MKRMWPLGIRYEALASHLVRCFAPTRMITAATRQVLDGGRTCDLGAKATQKSVRFWHTSPSRISSTMVQSETSTGGTSATIAISPTLIPTQYSMQSYLRKFGCGWIWGTASTILTFVPATSRRAWRNSDFVMPSYLCVLQHRHQQPRTVTLIGYRSMLSGLL